MIVSASRRTDIPAFFADWFYRRLEKGFVLLKNPYNPLQVGRVMLTPDKVDGFVFWTKNAAPMLPRLQELDGFKYYFQFTITPYGRDVERHLPDKQEVVLPAFRSLGKGKAIWRYDPVFLSERYPWAYHLRAFTALARELEGYATEVVMSFVDSYRSVDLRPLKIQPLTSEQRLEMAQELREIAAGYGMVLSSCAEELGLPSACCVDGKRFGVDKPRDRYQRSLCCCTESVDIGAYNTCRHGCVYCYANPYGRVQALPDVESDVLGPPITGRETIKQRN